MSMIDPRDEKIDQLERSLKELRRQNRDLRSKCANQRHQIAAKDAALARFHDQARAAA